MKKDRNCGAQPYQMPLMQNYQGAIPVPMMQPGIQPIIQPGVMGYPMMSPNMYTNMNQSMYTNTQATTNTSGSNINQTITSLQNQVRDLERRVSSIETVMNGTNYSSNYNTTNYQMM